jgi:hypothetical protein
MADQIDETIKETEIQRGRYVYGGFEDRK